MSSRQTISPSCLALHTLVHTAVPPIHASRPKKSQGGRLSRRNRLSLCLVRGEEVAAWLNELLELAWWIEGDDDDDDDDIGGREPLILPHLTAWLSAFLALTDDDPCECLPHFDAVLEVKLSSVDYAALTSTRVSVGALRATATVDLSTRFIPGHLYASVVNATMSKLPLVRESRRGS